MRRPVMLARQGILLVLIAALVVTALAQPWTPQVIWLRQGQGDSSRYGVSVLALGDQNNDGYADFGVY
jgi:hypothetical protein